MSTTFLKSNPRKYMNTIHFYDTSLKEFIKLKTVSVWIDSFLQIRAKETPKV